MTIIVLSFSLGVFFASQNRTHSVSLVGHERIHVGERSAYLRFINDDDLIVYVGGSCQIYLKLTRKDGSVIGEETLFGPGAHSVRVFWGGDFPKPGKFGFFANGNAHVVATKAFNRSSLGPYVIRENHIQVLADVPGDIELFAGYKILVEAEGK